MRKFRLNQLSDDGIKKLGNNLFLMFGNEDKGNEFYVRVKDLDDEIKSNPLLLSQLAIVYDDSGVVPQTIVDILDAVSAIMLKRDEFKDIEIPQGYQEMVDNLSYWLAAFAAERYSCISRGETVTALEMFKKLLKQDYKSSYGSRAKFLLEYIRSRAIYIEDNDGNGEFYHKMFSEYFTAVYYCEEAFVDYSKIDKSVISELFAHYSDPYWAKVLQLFLIKADSSIKKEKIDELYKLILSENKIEEYTLLLDCCRDLIVHKQEAQTVLVSDILQKSADGVYPPYGPLFWYVPEYGLYETALFAASYLKGNAKALALVRDICYIYGQKNSIDAITEKINGQELFDAASPDLSGVRRALCEIFYLGDTKYKSGKDIYPRCFNVAETLSFRDYSCGLFGRMKTPFKDELGLYSHTSYNILNGGAIGLVSCPYDAAEIEKKLSGMESFKLRGLIFSPTEEKIFEFVYFTRINVQVLYLPENIIGTDGRFKRYMPLICDVYANKEGVSYFFGDVKLPPLYPVMSFSECRTIKSVVIAEGMEEIRDHAFQGCSSLQKIEIPDGVRKIGDEVFRDCNSLQEIRIPEGVRKIGDSAFKGCSSLQKIEIPKGLKEIGSAVFEGCSSLQKIKIPEGVNEIGFEAFRGCCSLQMIEIPEGVREIGFEAFRGCGSLQKIKIPKGVEKIGDSVFEGCSSLQMIEIPEGVNGIFYSAFEGCSSLQMIEIPEGVRWIGRSAFKCCSSLQEIKIPESVENISSCAFEACSNLKEIKIPEGVKVIGESVFTGCSSLKKITLSVAFEPIVDTLGLDYDTVYIEWVSGSSSEIIVIEDGTEEISKGMFKDSLASQFVIPLSVKKIAARAFLRCRRLKIIEIPGGTKEIGDSAFEGCSSLREIEIPEGVRVIGEFAFSGCSSLQEIKIPEGVKKIEFGAFRGCSNLQKIEIPEGVEEIGSTAFYGCSSLQHIKIPEEVGKIGSAAFEGCSSLQKIEMPKGVEEIDWSTFEGCSSLLKIEIPEGVSEIGDSAFEGCSSLQKIEIPEGVSEIGGSAFEGCSSLQKIEIPEGVSEIGEEAFRGCSSLQEIEIPEGVEWIGESAFNGCSNLQKVEIPEGVEEIRESAFNGCSSLKEIVIPQSVIDIGDDVFKGCVGLESVTISINFKNDIPRIFVEIDPKIIHFT